ncbi:MAG: glycosyltransferase family 2 protein [Elusimicrobiota bacterium]
MDISIIIVSYNTCELLKKCLETVYKAIKNLKAEIFVVDNASSDGSADMVESKFPEVILIRNQENLGFSKANNQALRICSARYVLLLNSDTEILGNALDVMVGFMDDHPEVGMINPKLVYPNMELQPFLSKVPSFWKGHFWWTIFWHTPLHFLFSKQYKDRMYIEKGMDYNKVSEVEWALGACMMVRKEVLEQVGLLDENFFFGGEDLDYSIRARRKGWLIYYVPIAVVKHYISGSSIKEYERRGIAIKKNEGMFYFCEKHHGLAYTILLRIIILVTNLIYLILRPIKIIISKDKKAEMDKFRYDLENIKCVFRFKKMIKNS